MWIETVRRYGPNSPLGLQVTFTLLDVPGGTAVASTRLTVQRQVVMPGDSSMGLCRRW